MTSKFKKGDIVYIDNNSDGSSAVNKFIGLMGKIENIDNDENSNYPITVTFDDDKFMIFKEIELKVVKESIPKILKYDNEGYII